MKREEDCCTRLQSPVEARPSPERASVSESGLSPGVQPECNDHLTSGTDDTSRTESSTVPPVPSKASRINQRW